MITELTVNEESIRQTIDEAADGLPIETGPYKEKSLKSIQPDMDHEKITDLLIKNALENIDEATRIGSMLQQGFIYVSFIKRQEKTGASIHISATGLFIISSKR